MKKLLLFGGLIWLMGTALAGCNSPSESTLVECVPPFSFLLEQHIDRAYEGDDKRAFQERVDIVVKLGRLDSYIEKQKAEIIWLKEAERVFETPDAERDKRTLSLVQDYEQRVSEALKFKECLVPLNGEKVQIVSFRSEGALEAAFANFRLRIELAMERSAKLDEERKVAYRSCLNRSDEVYCLKNYGPTPN
jgi:hypothetical protein